MALISSNWTLSGTGADGQPVQMSGTSIDILRRQQDGIWKVTINNPYGV